MPNKVRLDPPPRVNSDLAHRSWQEWFSTVHQRLGQGPFLLQGYVVAALPDATEFGTTGTLPFSSMIFVSDETGGATLAFSDGTNWRRVQDRAIVS